MAATLVLVESNGGIPGTPASTTTLTNMNFSLSDTANTTVSASQNPLPLPVSGTSYSLTKWIQVAVTAWGGMASVGNFKVWNSSGAPWATTLGLGLNLQRGIAAGDYASFGAITQYGHSDPDKNGGGPLAVLPDVNGNAILGQAITWASTLGAGNVQIATSLPAQNLGTAGSLAPGTLLSGGGAPQYTDFIAIGLWYTSAQAQGDAGSQTISYQWDES